MKNRNIQSRSKKKRKLPDNKIQLPSLKDTLPEVFVKSVERDSTPLTHKAERLANFDWLRYCLTFLGNV